jgi:hypothetical protein
VQIDTVVSYGRIDDDSRQRRDRDEWRSQNSRAINDERSGLGGRCAFTASTRQSDRCAGRAR